MCFCAYIYTLYIWVLNLHFEHMSFGISNKVIYPDGPFPFACEYFYDNWHPHRFFNEGKYAYASTALKLVGIRVGILRKSHNRNVRVSVTLELSNIHLSGKCTKMPLKIYRCLYVGVGGMYILYEHIFRTHMRYTVRTVNNGNITVIGTIKPAYERNCAI